MDLDIRVHWQEKRSLLKINFPFTDIQEVKIQGRGATIQKDTIEQEEPIHGWLRTDTLEILQNELFADDRIDDHIRLKFVRSYIIDTILIQSNISNSLTITQSLEPIT